MPSTSKKREDVGERESFVRVRRADGKFVDIYSGEDEPNEEKDESETEQMQGCI